MPKRYGIHVEDNNLELIRFLNKGLDIAKEKKSTYFVFDVISQTEVSNRDVVFENDLYDAEEHLKEDIILLI